MRQFNQPVVNAQTNATTNFPCIDIGQIYAASFIANFSDAAAAGTLKVQVSNDAPSGNNIPLSFTPTNWIDLPSASVVVAAGATSLITMPSQLAYRWLRLVWTRTGGAGTITVNGNFQGF